MSVPTRLAPSRQIEVRIPVPVSIIPASALTEIEGTCVLGDDVTEILAPLADEPGFIGFKAWATPDLMDLLNGPHAHLLYDNVTRDGVVEIGVYGKIQGALINWDRKVYVMGEESGLPELVFEIPSEAEVWVCGYVTAATCGSLMSAFYTPDPNESSED